MILKIISGTPSNKFLRHYKKRSHLLRLGSFFIKILYELPLAPPPPKLPPPKPPKPPPPEPPPPPPPKPPPRPPPPNKLPNKNAPPFLSMDPPPPPLPPALMAKNTTIIITKNAIL